MEPPQAPLTINDLPPALLARIITLMHPRRDGLALLLTCRHWLAVAEAECPQHLWGAIVVRSDEERLLEQQAQAALLAGLRRRAACLSELRIAPWAGDALATAAGLGPFWPEVLQAAAGSPDLRLLHLDSIISDPDCFVPTCEALGSLTGLQRLTFQEHATIGHLPLPALCHLATLTRLEWLELQLTPSTGELPPDLLWTLGSLTRLALRLSDQNSVAWRRPDGSGPMLRQLRMTDCRIGLPSDRLLPALGQLERLELSSVALDDAQLSILPQLPLLTSLILESMRVPWPAVLCCAMLRELDVHPTNNPPAHLPPGSLPQLTRLVVDGSGAPPALLALPQLRTLKLTGGVHLGALSPSLGRCQQLEELVVWCRTLQEVTRVASSLTRLTRLEVWTLFDAAMSEEGLHEGPYLAGLRQLKHRAMPSVAPTWHLPAFLAAAAALELLDLGRDGTLQLRGAEDAALLRSLPRLRRVRLPLRAEDGKEAAAVVECIRGGLWEGAGAGAGPSHGVEVEGVIYLD